MKPTEEPDVDAPWRAKTRPAPTSPRTRGLGAGPANDVITRMDARGIST